MDQAGQKPPVDQAERERALDTKQSFLVQAPAGAGKTHLLTMRLLKLLAEVNEPEEILAITFTKAATAEMRHRVLSALQRARDTDSSSDEPELQLARAALRNDTARGWHLLQQPQRLNIQTIDAVCLEIAHRTPLLSRLGGSLSPTEKAQPHYDLAARRLLSRLGDGGVTSEALRALLQLRSASLNGCQGLIAGMLGKRDQWRRVMHLEEPVDWPQVRTRLEMPLRQLHQKTLAKAQSLFASDPGLTEELLALLEFACGNPCADQEWIVLKDFTSIEQLTSHDHWMGLHSWLFTGGGTFRKTAYKTQGFPNGSGEEKRRYKELLEACAAHPEMLALFCELRSLPPASFSEEEFALLKHLLLLLRYAVAELRVVFAERSEVDFVELGMAAREALTDEEGRSGELAAEVAERWRHLLVDEFQDTSRSQYELVTLLTEGWESGERGSCFLVGDPMQSIYGFRQAEVELFERTRRHGLGAGPSALPLTPIQLQTNFRSHAGLVDRLNRIFRQVFARDAAQDRDDYQVNFVPSEAQDRGPYPEPAVRVWPRFLPPKATGEEKRACADGEARQVVSIIQEHWHEVEAARRSQTEYRIAVLVRAKSHLGGITERLRKEDIPFRAIEIEQLGEKQEVRDLTALTQALLHPMDRVAWLSILRAPWCGLGLHDLHTLCGQDDRAFAERPVIALLRDRMPLLSTEGQQRGRRVHAILEDALRGKHRQASFARWIERTWATLGGHACVDRAAYENVRAFFDMLEPLGQDSATLAARLEDLCAQPDPRAEESRGVQLMTIHKAKGLGFDLVIVPGMERSTQSDDHTLLRWLEQTRLVGTERQEEHTIVVAPIGANGQSGGIYKWIGQQQRLRQDEETKRMFYVAATRARKELHLLGTATMKASRDGVVNLRYGNKRSLLEIARPAVSELFEAAYEQREMRPPPPGPPEPALPQPESTIALRRLPSDWVTPGHARQSAPAKEAAPEVVSRPFGSLATRAFGTVVHALMEDLAQVPESQWMQVDGWRPRALALLRAAGLPRAEAEPQSVEVVRALKAVLQDATGRWILGGRTGAETEVAWSSWAERGVSTLRGDRIFCAGAEPGSLEETHLWIVDYKTSRHGQAGLEAFLAEEKEKYSAQLEAYGAVLTKMPEHALPLRRALYFPLLSRLVWW